MSPRRLPPGDKTLSPLGIVPRFARDPFGFLMEQRRRYGDVLTMQGPLYRPNILINDPDLVYQILVTQADQFQKPPLLHRPFMSTFGNGLFQRGRFLAVAAQTDTAHPSLRLLSFERLAK